MSISDRLFMLAVDQHERRKHGKINIARFINLFYNDYEDYCMEAWVEWTLANK